MYASRFHLHGCVRFSGLLDRVCRFFVVACTILHGLYVCVCCGSEKGRICDAIGMDTDIKCLLLYSQGQRQVARQREKDTRRLRREAKEEAQLLQTCMSTRIESLAARVET